MTFTSLFDIKKDEQVSNEKEVTLVLTPTNQEDFDKDADLYAAAMVKRANWTNNAATTLAAEALKVFGEEESSVNIVNMQPLQYGPTVISMAMHRNYTYTEDGEQVTLKNHLIYKAVTDESKQIMAALALASADDGEEAPSCE